MIAAAGTGGHVYPGLAVGEALVHRGVPRDHVGFVGGDRLEADVYPTRGFRFMDVELVGLQRRMTLDNLRIPAVVLRARRDIARMIGELEVAVVLGMGGYVTIPAGLAARSRRVPFFNAEQNASAGLANRVSARWAEATFVSFPDTAGLPRGRWVGNPVREPFWAFDRDALRAEGLVRYGLEDELPTLGVFGGSLGAGAINDAIAALVQHWSGGRTQVVHLTGEAHHDTFSRRSAPESVVWRRVAFEERMDLFFAVCDLVVSRAGGAVAELTATGTPSVLIPGRFGSGGHQDENARFLASSGAAVVIDETDVAGLAEVIDDLLG
ncbi:MAG: UDP-N-acetylglucosamine--N-acetylmuramyl-(pentapeptide) pyrophosphoryl-undecaprenol N-acetylglucosamine transferase, partial [Acidimicrobiia bacterium]